MRSARPAWSIGARPVSSPTTIAAPAANSTVRGSRNPAAASLLSSSPARSAAPPQCAMSEPSDAAEDREQHALGEQLREQPAAAHAEREAQRDLAPALERAREQQIRDVRAGDEQHDDRHAADPRRDLRDARRVRPALGEDRPDDRARPA